MSETTERNIGAPGGPWLRYPAAADHTGISESKLRKLVMADRVPHRKVGRSVVFSVPALDEWINSGSAAESEAA